MLLVFLAFDVVVLQFVLTSAIQHSRIQFLYSNCRFDIVCFTIQHYSLKYSTLKFTAFNIQVYAIQHSTFEYPTAGQSMTVSVGSAKYQNSPLVGARKRQVTLPCTVAFRTCLDTRQPGSVYKILDTLLWSKSRNGLKVLSFCSMCD